MTSSPPASQDRGGRLLGTIDQQARSHPWALDGLLALAVAAVLGPLTSSSLQGSREPAGWLAVAAVAFGVLHVSVAFRRRDPAAAYVAASLAMLVVVAVPDFSASDAATGRPISVPMVFLPSSPVFLLLLYSYGSQPQPWRYRQAALLIAITGAVLAGIRAGAVLHQVYPVSTAVLSLAATAILIMVVFGAWSLGSLRLVQRQRAEARVAEAARIAVLEERGRISRDMHDVVAHTLAVIVRQAEGGAFAAQRAPDQAAQALRVIADVGREALADLRGMLGVLRGDGDVQAGGPATASPAAETGPQPTLGDVPALLDRVRSAGLSVDYASSGTEFRLSPTVELAIYRVLQEALTNAVKHAGPAARVTIRLEWTGGGLDVEIISAGGERTATPVPGAGAGLRGLTERVTAAGGTFRSGPDGDRFAVRASFPRRDH